MAEGAGQTLGIDWGMVSAVIAFFALVGMVIHNQHGQLLAQVRHPIDRPRIRQKLTTDAGIAQRFRDGIEGLISRIDTYFGPRLGWRAFDRCLLHAYLYPILLFVAAWVAGAGGNLGTIPLLAEVGVWQRLWVFAILVLTVGLVLSIFSSIPLIKSLLRRRLRKVLELLLSGTTRSESEAEALIAQLVAVPITVAVAAVGGGAVAVAGAGAGAETGAAAVTFAGAGAFFGAFAGAMAGKSPFAGAGGVAVAVAAVSAVAAVGAGSVAGAIKGAFAGAFAGTLETAATILTFYLALPVANAFLDWVSWAWTRWLLRRPTNGESATRSVSGITARLLVDLGLAFVSLCLLALLLPNVIEATNRVFAWLEWPTITWLPLLNLALEAPFTQGLFVTGMLLTTLLPTLLHVVAGLFGVFAVWGGGGRAMAARIPVDATAPMAESDCQAVAWFLIRRRLWLIPATIATVLLVVPLAWLLSLFIGPIGLFLADLALCGTSWSHGLCPLLD